MLPLEEISVVFSITESSLFHSFLWFDFLCLTYDSEQLSGRVSIAVKEMSSSDGTILFRIGPSEFIVVCPTNDSELGKLGMEFPFTVGH